MRHIKPYRDSDMMEVLPLCVFFLLFFLFVYQLVLLRRRGSQAGLPPGKMGLPVVGEYPSFMMNGRKGKPEKFILDRMATHSARAFKTWLIGGPTVVMCGADGNRFLFSNDNKLVRVWFPASIHKILPSSSSSDALHAKKLLLHLLLPDNLQRYTSIVDKLARSHFTTYWEGISEVKVQPLARNYTFAVACKLFFNIDDYNQIAEFEEAFDHVVSGIVSLPVNLPGMAFNRAIKAAESIKKELLHMVRLRKKAMAGAKCKINGSDDGGDVDDLLSRLLLSNVDETNSKELMMSDEQIVDRMLAVLVASRDSASSTISFLIKYLGELPQIYQAVYQEQMEIARRKVDDELLNWDDIRHMKYSWNVVSEVLRLASPYQAAYREVVQGFQYASYNIPKGWKIMWNTNSTHMNPEYFPDPQRFDPSRFEGKGAAPYAYVPFGGGSRVCPGKDYTKLEVLVYLHNIIKRFKWEKILSNEKIIVEPMPIHVQGLPIRLYPLTIS